jgi:hypothetical protein
VTERWLPVVGYEGLYEVSDLGRVRSLARDSAKYINRWGQTITRRVEARIRKAAPGKRGHPVLSLTRDGQMKMRPVHQLVLEAFVGPCPPGEECCHGNDVKIDNRLENLRWDTSSANSYDRVRNGIHPMASKTQCVKGHPFDEANTLIISGGRRYCRQCANARSGDYQARKRAANWTADEDAIVARGDLYTLTDLCHRLGRSRQAVAGRRARLRREGIEVL